VARSAVATSGGMWAFDGMAVASCRFPMILPPWSESDVNDTRFAIVSPTITIVAPAITSAMAFKVHGKRMLNLRRYGFRLFMGTSIAGRFGLAVREMQNTRHHFTDVVGPILFRHSRTPNTISCNHTRSDACCLRNSK